MCFTRLDFGLGNVVDCVVRYCVCCYVCLHLMYTLQDLDYSRI